MNRLHILVIILCYSKDLFPFLPRFEIVHYESGLNLSYINIKRLKNQIMCS